MRAVLPLPPGLIDTHVHLWDPARGHRWLSTGSPLNRAFDLPDLMAAVGENHRSTTMILVEADRGDDGEAADLLRTAREHRLIGGVVVGPDLRTSAGADLLRRLLGSPDHRYLLGVRQQISNLRDIDLVSVHRSWLEHHQLVMELNMRWHTLELAAVLARRLPETPVVLNHCGGPPQVNRPDKVASWTSGLAGVAAMGNTYVKLSGTLTRQFGPQPLTPLATSRITLDVFGPGRSMLGSDWPVCLTAGSWRESISAGLGVCTVDEVDLLAAGTARSTYRIPATDKSEAVTV